MMPIGSKSFDKYRSYDGIHYEPGYHVRLFKCDECWDTNCFECQQGYCNCYCRTSNNYYTPKPEHGYDPLPEAGTAGRRKWIGRNASPVNDGKWHLHALLNRGRVQWVLTSVGSGVCKQPGRCKLIELTLRESNATP